MFRVVSTEAGGLSRPLPLPLGRVVGSGLRGSLALGTGPGRVG